MKSYKGYEITAINTNGLWYPYIAQNGKCVHSDTRGFNDRDVAIGVAEAIVNISLDEDAPEDAPILEGKGE